MTGALLEKVLAETWEPDGTTFVGVFHGDPRLAAGPAVGSFSADSMWNNTDRHAALSVVRASVCALGKRALALLLECEWDKHGECDCCFGHESQGHEPGCEWGAICDEARKLP